VEQEYGVGEPITVAVGYTMRNAEVNYSVDGNTLMVREPATPKASGVYFGAVLPAEFGAAVETEYENPDPVRKATYRLVLATVPYTPGAPLTYYTGFGWEKWGEWTAEKFAEYLANFDAALKTPLAVQIDN
jgi:hypothetical protein